MITIQTPFLPCPELKLETVSLFKFLKRTNRFKLFANRRAGKDSWSIYNEVKRQAAVLGENWDSHIICSPYDGYALLCFRW